MRSALQSFCFLVFFIGLSLSCQSQDIITKKNGKKISAWIKEVSDQKVKYLEVGDPNEIIFTIDRTLISGIEFNSGKNIKKPDVEYSEDYFAEDKSQSIKFNFLAFRLNALNLSYEKALTPMTSFEGSIKLLGIKFFENVDNGKGFALDIAYKLKLKSIFTNDASFKPRHLLEGSYFSPKIGFNYINEDFFFGGGQNGTTKARLINMGLDIGKQWVVNDFASLDAFIGFHYFGGPVNRVYPNGQTDDFNSYSFNVGDLSGNDNVAISFGIKMGALFGQYETQSNSRKRK